MLFFFYFFLVCLFCCFFFFFFFFQAEDGIRDWSVTGVQTCALPILVFARTMFHNLFGGSYFAESDWRGNYLVVSAAAGFLLASLLFAFQLREIGRASCRERV